MKIDPGGMIYGVYSDPLSPRSCTTDAGARHSFVVALDRSKLPESPFQIALVERRSCPECTPNAEVTIDLDE